MAGTGSNKPIVFVFGAKKGDAESRKKNLSAINTQVAYRAHERRREKKNRQRAQAKEEGKVDQQTSSASNETPSLSLPTNNQTTKNVDFHYFNPPATVLPTRASYPVTSRIPNVAHSLPEPASYLVPDQAELNSTRPIRHRRSSDNNSDTSSDNDAVWSLSPGSNRQSTPGTELSSYSPPAYASGMTNGYFEKGLDPFFRLPTVATDRERWLVHFCKFHSDYKQLY